MEKKVQLDELSMARWVGKNYPFFGHRDKIPQMDKVCVTNQPCERVYMREHSGHTSALCERCND